MSLVCSNNREQVVALEELAGGIVTGGLVRVGLRLGASYSLARSAHVREEVRAAADMVVDKVLGGILLVSKVLERVRPENVAHEAVGGGLPEAVDRTKVVKGMELGGEAAVDAEELLVHNGGEGQVAKRVHAGIVDRLRVLVLA